MLEEWVHRDTTAQQDSPHTFCLGSRPHGQWTGTSSTRGVNSFPGLSPSAVRNELALMLCDASGAEFGLMQWRGPGVELAQNAWTVAK